MSNQKLISFNEYYIYEFFNNVREKTVKELSSENHQLIDNLFKLLSRQEELTEGIGKLAQEKASGELSIFLFDIFDRAQDYPPTELVDALSEIAEDFVSALEIMLEEEGTIEAIEKVNSQFRTGSTDKVSEEMVAEKDEELQIEESDQKDAYIEGMLSFQDYIESSFFKYLKNQLNDDKPNINIHSLLNFTRNILDSIDKSALQNAPEQVSAYVTRLKQVFPWRVGKPVNYVALMDHYSQLLADCQSALRSIKTELIDQVVEQGDVSVLQIKEKKEDTAVAEAISEEPTTIDNLLSEYFQAEVDQHLHRLDEIFNQFKEQPAERKFYDQLKQAIQSFKEICMIHGYVLLEDFSAEMTTLIEKAKKARKIFNTQTDQPYKDLVSLLKQANRFKESKPQSAESDELDNILQHLETTLFISPEKIEKQPVKPSTETIAETKIEEIAFEDTSAINQLFFTLLRAMQSILKEKLAEGKENLTQLSATFITLSASAQMIEQSQIAEFLEDFSKSLSESGKIEEKNYVNAQKDLKNIYSEFCELLSDRFEAEAIRSRLDDFHKTYLDETTELNFSDRSELLAILLEVEKNYSPAFADQLLAALIHHDAGVHKVLTRHLRHLSKNFKLLDLDKFCVLPDSMINHLKNVDRRKYTEDDIQHITKRYHDILNIILEQGDQAALEEGIDQLKKAMLTEKIEAEQVTEPEVSEPGAEEIKEAAKSADISEEEDLDEIFKSESENYLVTIDNALAELSENKSKTDLYANIEKSLHSLKSSARLLGHNDIADVAAPLEEIFEILHNTLQELNSDDLQKISKTSNQLKAAVSGSEIESEKLIEELRTIELKSDEVADTVKEPETIREEQLFAGSVEEDEDLLDIFKEESSQNIRIVEEANKTLQKDFQNKQALSQLENAMHSLKSAAKMLGFKEIGDLADAVENSAVAVLRGEVQNGIELNKCVANAIELIKELTEGNKQNIGELERIISDLHVQNFVKPDQKGIEQKPSTVTPPVTEPNEQTKLFIKEGWELLEKINRDMVNLEQNPKDQDIIENLNRSIHTLKGSAQILNFKQIGTLAHKIEDLFEKSKASGTGLNDETTDLIFKAIDKIDETLNSLKSGGTEKNLNLEPLISSIDQILETDTQQAAVEKSEPEVHQAEETTASSKKAPSREYGQEVKISTGDLDNLINMAAELLVSKSQLSAYLEKLKKLREAFDDDKKRLKHTNRIITTFLDKSKRDENRSKPVSLDKGILGDLESVSVDFNDVLKTFDNVSGSFRTITQDFEQNIGQISNLTKSIHDDILQVRMVPAEMLFNRFPRAIRDMAKNLKKKVSVVVEGEDTEMDRALIESLTDPVLHLIRNAIDHGIETPDERKAQGKNEDGLLLLKAKREKNQIVIEVQDDGRGIDPEVVSKVLKDKGLVDEKELTKLSTSEILSHLFSPGFSTRKQATDMSGRGVGLDVVAHKIQELKGDIQLNSESAKGTIFTIRVPLTLAIAQAMLVEIGTEVLAIPIASVEETIQFKDPELVEQDEKVFITVSDKLIPVVYLSGLLKFSEKPQAESDGSHTAVIVQDSGARYGLIVDNVLRREEIVIKSLGDHLSQVPYISGGTIYGDGSVGLILDIPSIAHQIRSDVYGYEKDFSDIDRARDKLEKEGQQVKSEEKPKKSAEKKEKKVKAEETVPVYMQVKKKKVVKRAPKAIIIDDALSVRKFVSSVLEKNGYQTVLADDGPEALKKIRNERFDVIITDLEMPQMHGFEMIKELRQYKKYQHIPIIILTGRADKKSKDRGRELGANEYVTKPFKENDLMKSLEDFIEIA